MTENKVTRYMSDGKDAPNNIPIKSMHNQKRKSFSLLHHCTKKFAIDIINGDFQNKKSTGVQYPTPKREPFTLPARHLHN